MHTARIPPVDPAPATITAVDRRRKRSVNEALPSSVSNRYSLSIRTQDFFGRLLYRKRSGVIFSLHRLFSFRFRGYIRNVIPNSPRSAERKLRTGARQL